MQKALKSNLANIILISLMVITPFFFIGCQELNQNKESVNPEKQKELEFELASDRPPTLKTLYLMSDIFATQGRDDQAEYVLRNIIREYPDFLPAYNSLSEIQMRQRRINEAIDTIYKGLQVKANDPVLLNNLGMCRMILKDYDEALNMFTQATGIVPNNAKYRANMAVALAFLGRDEEALNLYRQILPGEQAKHNLEIIRLARNKTSKTITKP